MVEVGPRDGLQNEAVALTVDERVELISLLVNAGARRLEAVAFAHPERVPAMAGAEEVMSAVPRRAGVSYAGLVLNRKGLDRAVGSGVDEINMVVCASDTFSLRNQNVTTDESMCAAEDVIEGARSEGLFVTVTIGVAFGCPYEGEIPVQRISTLARRARAAGAQELCLADSVGVGVPRQVRQLIGAVEFDWSPSELRFHFHNTRNTGYANAVAAIDAGVRVLDASIGGIGGCPFAPAATGNIATDDLLYLLQRSGLALEWRRQELPAIVAALEARLGHSTPSLLPGAGDFIASPCRDAGT